MFAAKRLHLLPKVYLTQNISVGLCHSGPNIPQNNPDNRAFGVWVNKMRSFKTKLEKGDETLSEVDKMKVEILKTLGFNWGGRKGEVAWEKNFSELLAFIDKHGHAKIPTKTSGGLGRGVCVQVRMPI